MGFYLGLWLTRLKISSAKILNFPSYRLILQGPLASVPLTRSSFKTVSMQAYIFDAPKVCLQREFIVHTHTITSFGCRLQGCRNDQTENTVFQRDKHVYKMNSRWHIRRNAPPGNSPRQALTNRFSIVVIYDLAFAAPHVNLRSS